MVRRKRKPIESCIRKGCKWYGTDFCIYYQHYYKEFNDNPPDLGVHVSEEIKASDKFGG